MREKGSAYKLLLALVIGVIVLTYGCGKEEGTGPTGGETLLYNSRGEEVSSLKGGETAFWRLTGLTARTQYNINLEDGSGNTVSMARLTTNQDGELPLTAIGYDLGLPFGTKSSVTDGDYTLVVTDLGGNSVADLSFPVDLTQPMVYAADNQGYACNSFLVGQHSIYAKGKNLTPDDIIDVYVVDDQNNWSEGMFLTDVSGGKETVTVGADGEFFQEIWASPGLASAYDVVADIDQSGTFSEGDLVDSYIPIGFMVQETGSGIDFQVQIACDANENYKDIFRSVDDVYASLNPRLRCPAWEYIGIYKYVTIHKGYWNDGDSLHDVTEGYEMDTPQSGCLNQGRTLIWPAVLTSGKYDVIIDVNQDRLYTKGVDFLDNIDSYGQPTAGFIVPTDTGAPVVNITSPEDGDSTTEHVVYLEGTVSDPTIEHATLIVNENSQTISVFQGNLEGTPIILRRGPNTIRVEAYNDGGLGYDEVTVYGIFEAVGMKITLTWDVGPHNDVDLHVQDPTGEWCWYSHMQTAIGGWLDVDDTEGWGPENFYLSQSAVDSTPGDYNVKVHYYDDAGEGPTTPTLHILLNEEQANQIERTIVGPHLNQTDDWWYAVTITMPDGIFSDYNPPAKERISSEFLPPKKK